MSSVIRYLAPRDGADDDPQFAGKIRVTEDGRISVYDAMAAIGISQPKVYWLRLGKEHPAEVTTCNLWKFPGERQRDTPVADRQGMAKIIMLLPGKIAAKFRDKVAVLLERYLDADRSLAEDILRRAHERDGAVANLQEHPRVKSCESTKELNNAIKQYSDRHEGCGVLYPAVHDINNLAVTGKTARQLKAAYSAKAHGSSRALNSKVQSAAMFFLQWSEADKIARTGANPVEVAKRSRALFEPVFRADGLHESTADRACIKENAKVMRLNQEARREAARIAV